jgi:transcriptional regulator with XRE-family HTH domain
MVEKIISFKKRLKEIRENKKLSRQKASKGSGIPQPTIEE